MAAGMGSHFRWSHTMVLLHVKDFHIIFTYASYLIRWILEQFLTTLILFFTISISYIHTIYYSLLLLMYNFGINILMLLFMFVVMNGKICGTGFSIYCKTRRLLACLRIISYIFDYEHIFIKSLKIKDN